MVIISFCSHSFNIFRCGEQQRESCFLIFYFKPDMNQATTKGALMQELFISDSPV